MYAGVPSAEPGRVSVEPLADEGISVPLTPRRIGPAGCLGHAQSTTSVSPCLPTIMLPGLISRCRTPRKWAYSIALQTSINRCKSLRRLERAPAQVRLKYLVAVKAFDRILERVATNKPHRIVRPAIIVGSRP